VPRGRKYTGKSKWLAPVTLEELRELETYDDFGARYPWAVRGDFGGPYVTSEREGREGVSRLERRRAGGRGSSFFVIVADVAISAECTGLPLDKVPFA
jgi:hypothetical protein